MRRQYFFLILVLLILLGIVFQRQITTNLKIILFITEEFPQIPVKPLGLLTQMPIRERVELDSTNGKVVADLRLPSVVQDKAAALILAMGIKTSEKDKPILLHFADSMARLGYITFWPRLEPLDKGESLPEEPETFIEAFKYLEGLPQTNSERITFVGFSVGSSTAFVASSDPQIADKVHSLVFFGGYFDIFDYLKALSSKMIIVDGQKVLWNGAQDAVDHAGGLLALEGLKLEDFHYDTLEYHTKQEYQRLLRFSPSQTVSDFKGRIFILHDKSDTYVPYTQSVKLYEAMPKAQIVAYHISDLFEHVQPNRPINLVELAKLYGFLYKVFSIL